MDNLMLEQWLMVYKTVHGFTVHGQNLTRVNILLDQSTKGNRIRYCHCPIIVIMWYA